MVKYYKMIIINNLLIMLSKLVTGINPNVAFVLDIIGYIHLILIGGSLLIYLYDCFCVSEAKRR